MPKRMSSRKRSIVFLVAAVIFLEKNITAFVIVASLMGGYMLTASTDGIVTLTLLIFNYSNLSSKSYASTMETR